MKHLKTFKIFETFTLGKLEEIEIEELLKEFKK